MEAAYNGWTWSTRRLAALFLAVAAVVLIAGGAGGYLIRGATTVHVTHTITRTVALPASQAPAGAPQTTGGYIPGL